MVGKVENQNFESQKIDSGNFHHQNHPLGKSSEYLEEEYVRKILIKKKMEHSSRKSSKFMNNAG